MDLTKVRAEVVTRSLFEISRINKDDFKKVGETCWVLFGGSGFVGRWLAASLIYNEKALNMDFNVIVVTRDKFETEKKLRKFFPRELGLPEIITVHEFFQISKMIKNSNKECFYVFGATPTTNFSEELSEIPNFFQRIINAVSDIDNPPTVLNLSSGAVYKNAFSEQELIYENYDRQDLGQSVNLYQKCKLSVEDILFRSTRSGYVKGLNPRLFTFAGPGFPLESHFAISNFVKSALEKRVICIEGHPMTSRSYMDPADMIIWLFRLMSMQDTIGLRSIHIGSNIAFSMTQLAEAVSEKFGGTSIAFVHSTRAIPNFYVPSTEETKRLLGVSNNWNLEDTLERWREYLTESSGKKESKWE